MQWYKKKCCRCKEIKPIEMFYKDKGKRDGYSIRCKECSKKSVNSELRKDYEKKYWDERREERRLISLRSFNKNKEHHKEVRKKYLKTEKGQISYKKYTQKRYALLKSAQCGKIDISKLYQNSNGECYYCGIKVELGNSHIDHYIPLSRGGKHEQNNLRISCKRCNLSKGSKMPWEVGYSVV